MLVSLLALAACGPSREAFQEQSVEISCQRTEECAPDEFAMLFDDVDECVAFVQLLDQDDCYDDCDYSSATAAKCMSALEDASCDEVMEGEFDDCEDVYECEDQDAVDECIAEGLS
ncbi:MAG: hypothetical protein ACOZNI_05920 [Myxococcota bacterium]